MNRVPDAAVWSKLGQYLSSDHVQLLGDKKRVALLSQWEDVSQQENALDDAILIGLVGGTGVGKSTFINALAGDRVSRSSDRRPTTDRVVVYRHVNTELPGEVPSTDFAQPEVLHDNDAIEKVVLFDFPDFDSAEETHTHIIRRYLPYLDVLLVVVDDVKYADRRLYELLATLDHDPQNIFALMNKIDRLEDRYGDTTEQVIEELMGDLKTKLSENARLELSDHQLFPIASLAILESREKNQDASSMDRFRKVELVLEGFQEDKHRRLAKERNLDARKRDLSESISSAALGQENELVLTESRKLVQGWRGALDAALQSVPVEILGDSERRGVHGTRLRQIGPRWGLPFALFFTLLGEIRRRRSQTVAPADLGQRVLHHYRGFFEAVKNVRARFESEFTGSSIRLAGKTGRNSPIVVDANRMSPLEAGGELQNVLQNDDASVPLRHRLFAHVPAMSTFVLAFWGQVYGILDGEMGLFGAIFDTLSPTFIIGTILGVLFVYGVTSLMIWLREIQKLDHRINQAEQATREMVRTTGKLAVDQLDANVNDLYEEFEMLQGIVD